MQLSACAKELFWAACPKATVTNSSKRSFRRVSRGPIPNFSASLTVNLAQIAQRWPAKDHLAVYVSNRLKHRRATRWPTNRYYQKIPCCTFAKKFQIP